VWAESRAAEPIIPLGFFRVRIFTMASLTGLLVSLWMFGGLFFLPLFVQGVMGYSATMAGAVMTPMMLSVIVGALVAGQLMTRTGRYKIMAVAAAVSMCLGLVLFTRLGVDAAWPAVVRNMVLAGLGIGTLLPTLNVAVQNAFPYRVMGVVNATQQFVRSLGGVVAAPILGSVLALTFARQMEVRLPPALVEAIGALPAEQQAAFLDPQSLTSAQTQAAIRAEFGVFGASAQELYEEFIAVVREALATGTQRLFLIALGFALAALVMTALLPEITLQRDEFFEGEEGEAQVAGGEGSDRTRSMQEVT
jgi:MFS family permease